MFNFLATFYKKSQKTVYKSINGTKMGENRGENSGKNNGKKRGFSIAEAVVALFLISIISASAILVITNSTQIEFQALQTMQISTDIENMVESFRFSSSQDEFENTLSNVYGDAYNLESDTLTQKNYSIKFVIYSETIINITVTNTAGNQTKSVSYEKR